MTTYNTGNPLGSSDPRDLYDNAENLDEYVNSDGDTFQDRLGKSRLTWSGIVKAGTGDAGVIVPIVQQAAQDAASAVIAGVDGQVAVAESAASRAESAAEVAMASGWVYTTVAAGEASRVDGDYFWVLSSDSNEVLELWLMGSSAATDTGKRTFSKGLLLVDGSLTFEQGGLQTANGEEALQSLDLRVRTGFLKYNTLEVSVISTQKTGVWFFDENKQFVSFSGYADSHSFYGNSGYVRVAVGNDDESPITPQSVSIQSIKADYPSVNLNRLGLKNEPNGLAGLDESGRLSDFAVTRNVIQKGSAIESWSGYDPKQLMSLEIWDREESDSFYLNTFYNYYYNGAFDRYETSLGFKRVSDDKHICIAPETIIDGDDPTKYARFVVTSPLTGIQEHYLYVEGDTTKPPVGMVRVNWDLVPTVNSRYLGTDGLSPVVTENLGKTVQKTKFIRSNEALTNPLLGKKIVGLGDSITYGFIPRNVPEYPGQLDSWLPLTAGKLGMSYVNYGISGSTLGDLNNGTRSPFTGRYQAMDDDADVIVVMGGTNDVRNGVPLGTMADRTPYTYYGALHVLCEGLIDKYQVQQGLTIGKEKIIFFMTPIKLLDPATEGLDTDIEPYVDAVKEVCAYYSLPVFDSYNLSGINPHILQTVVGTVPGYTGNYNPYITDGTHPTQEGHEKMSRVIAGFIKSLA